MFGEKTQRMAQSKRCDSPEPSCVSMKSDQSMDKPVNLKENNSSELSSVSMKSDQSMDKPVNLQEDNSSSELRVQKETSEIRKNVESVFKELEHKIISQVKDELKSFVKLLSLEREMEDKVDQCSVREGVLKITLHILRTMNQTDLANTLQSKLAPACHRKLKSTLKERFQKINEGIPKHGNSTLLHDIYTELYITEGGDGEINNEHEVRQIETACRRPATQETLINCNDIFREKSIRTVLTKGVAGIGKTVSVQKFILDWAEGKANQDILFIFPLPFRELNLMKNERISLEDLLHQFFSDTTELKLRDYYRYKILFIFDGLDECRLPLNFHNNKRLSDIKQSASVDVLLTNLIKGNLLPSALLWITSRPAACGQIPPECVDQITEVRGFNDSQKEEYFRKRISDQNLVNKIITHMKTSRSLYIMCHIPVFCWIAATVLEGIFGKEHSEKMPKTLTQMFTHFLIFQIKQNSQKYQEKMDLDPGQTKKIIWTLGKLAFQQLEKGNLIFYEEDLRDCGIDVKEVSVYSGVCTQIFREEFELHLGKVYSFVHLSIQEFLAALFAFLSFISETKNVLEQHAHQTQTMTDFLKSAVDKALHSETGHLDLFLRFLLGLSLESSQTLLQGLLPKTGSRSHSNDETIEYIKEKIRNDLSPEKSINFFHCLNELNDHSLVQEVQKYLNRKSDSCLSGAKLSPAQWSALVFVLLNSEEELNEFDLRKYESSEECLKRLLPVVKASFKALLCDCNLIEESCAILASALNSSSSNLRELDLSNNKVQDLGVKKFSAGLENPHCKLKKLKLCWCNLTHKSCAVLVSILTSNYSSLRELDLSNNDLQDPGVERLSAALENPDCKLEILRLCDCNFTEEGCAALALALSSENSSLRELDLSDNELQNSGVKLLSTGLENSHCKLEILRLSACSITEEGCATLTSALKSNPSHLIELNLNYSEPGESGVELLSDLLKDPHCKLEKLQLECCSITEKGFAALASALKSNPSYLKELNLDYNKPGESGVKLLSELLEDPLCKLQKLNIDLL
ncbi:NACHT, LRR and PYD domains-containing protein 12-like [Pygocentrus nattereri]|uniref:NACHT, LRR and PYD domains-containing protein 12-like n=1 Tax=Pygocentrus nattereri TaxID=42514 RepID=UPI00081490B2|nr:NACHT, LRR and PYD domains-containing protein 12-like [Pygocentrus nattereri]